MRFVAAGFSSVLRLNSCSCRQSLDVGIAAFAAATVRACLAVSKVVSSLSAVVVAQMLKSLKECLHQQKTW